MSLPSARPSIPSQAAQLAKLKAYLVSAVTHDLELSAVPLAEQQKVIRASLEAAFQQTKVTLPDSLRIQLFRDIVDELTGYGPIQPLLEDPEITEIMVNGPKKIYVERKGKLVKTNVTFENDEHVMRTIERIVLPLGRRVDADSPTVDARLPDGSRVNAIIPPVAIDGPSITIRKFSKEKLTIQQLIEFKSLTPQMAEFLKACVVSRLNIIVSGGTGSGKTTLLNVLSSFIPAEERIVTIEDAAELRLHQEHVVRTEAKPANIEGRGQVTIRDLVRNALRMRPDRIIIGEVRGGEALDMLQAMNTGHDGSLTTLHANSPRDALSRLETMVLMAGIELPVKVIRQQIASAIDLIVQQSRLKDGTRKIVAITEVAGMEGDTIVMTDIYKFEQSSVRPDGTIVGDFKPTGIRPLFSPRLEAAGYKLGAELFATGLPDAFAADRRRR